MRGGSGPRRAGSQDATRLNRFYRAMTSLDGAIAALKLAGVDTDANVAAADLYTRGIDCHNLGGYRQLEAIANAVATVEAPNSDDGVLDLGCGLGGPSRFIADRFGCSVTGADVAPLRVDAARALAELTNTTTQTQFLVADATSLPFDDARFAQVWMMDVSIHVRDKRPFFSEIARVLRRDGLLVLHDQLGPLPPSMRAAKLMAPYFAPSLPQLIRLLHDAGLRPELWRDTTKAVLDVFYQRRELAASIDPSTLGRHAREAARGMALLNGYIEALECPRGCTGMIIARRL